MPLRRSSKTLILPTVFSIFQSLIKNNEWHQIFPKTTLEFWKYVVKYFLQWLVGYQLACNHPFSLWKPTLKIGVWMVNLKEVDKIEELIVSLDWLHICSLKNPAFSFRISTGTSVNCTPLFIYRFLVSFIQFFVDLGKMKPW